ncbi:transglycosylase SLT domain-containing protein [Arcobacter sp. LA11]|uniref:transglycosylase SLT domain-containing protein n=1 Tax=Arcobacter sp. LA11 TaxID=1898176 RepID=UPI000932F767|nr:transglycosylase SLT domain-containing protein [Arcobacter sp. LA11]
MKHLIFLLACIFLLNAQEIEKEENQTELTFDWLLTLNKGIKRDFYVNEYLQKDISSEDSLKALSLVDNLTNEMFFNFAKAFKHDETLAVAQCMQMDTRYLVDSYADCIVIGLSLEEATTLSSIDIDLIVQKTREKYPTFVKKLKVISSSIPFTKLIISKKDDFYDIYLNVDSNFRTKYFNYKLPKRTFLKIFIDKNKFDKFIAISLTNEKLKKVHNSLLEVDDSLLNHNSSFLLALNSLNDNNLNSAYIYLENAISKTKDKKTIDKYLFWKYYITKDEDILENLSNSINLNLYSTLANELLAKPLLDDSFLESLDPFDILTNDYDSSRIALLYAIAKIKSKFDANKISKNFEVGIMQLKTSLLRTISTNLNERYSSFSQFNMENSIKYANIHLNNLENLFKDPIYLFLAYEGNIKLLNKSKENIFKSDDLFKSLQKLEYVSNIEKEYLKDFILYYYYFYNKLTKKEKLTLSSIFENQLELDQKLND